MEQMITQGTRMMQAGLDAWRLGFQLAETLAASQAVIGKRMMMIGAGMTGRGPMPVSELTRLVPEKAAAFHKAGAQAAKALKTGSAVPLKQLDSALRDDGMAMLEIFERSVALSTAWWTPVHSAVTGNARRLSRKGR